MNNNQTQVKSLRKEINPYVAGIQMSLYNKYLNIQPALSSKERNNKVIDAAKPEIILLFYRNYKGPITITPNSTMKIK